MSKITANGTIIEKGVRRVLFALLLVLGALSSTAEIHAEDGGGLISPGYQKTDTCLKTPNKPDGKFFLIVNATILPILIETSQHATSQITASIAQIILTDFLSYANVTTLLFPTFTKDPIDTFRRVSGCYNTSCVESVRKKVPDSMVSLDTWTDNQSLVRDWVGTGHMNHAGFIGAKAGFGWFVPKWFVEYMWQEYRIIGEHWKSLLLPESAEQLHIAQSALEDYMVKNHTSNEYYCSDSFCQAGMFRSSGCQSDQDMCAVLLSDYPDNHGTELIAQVEGLGINVSIAWVGPNLEALVRTREEEEAGTPTLFFNWVPNSLVPAEGFVKLVFPQCISGSDPSQEKGCDFSTYTVQKVMWTSLADSLPEIYQFLVNLELTQQQLEDMLDDYRTTQQEPNAVFITACKWLKNNYLQWGKWLPERASNYTMVDLYFSGMFPESGRVWSQPGIRPGVDMAIELINADDTILNYYRVHLLPCDSKCSQHQALICYSKTVQDKAHIIPGIIGPGCSDAAEPLAALSATFHTQMISYGAESSSLSDRTKYPYFFRTYPNINETSDAYLALFQSFGWEQYGLITEDGDFAPFVSELKTTMDNNKVSLVFDEGLEDGDGSVKEYSSVILTISKLKKSTARIVIGNFYEYYARALLCEAYKQQVTGVDGYIWFLPAWFSREWWDVDHYNNKLINKENLNCTTKQMQEAINGYMGLSRMPEDPSTVIIGNISSSQWELEYRERIKEEDFTHYAGYAYDVMWTYALALDKLLKEDPLSLNTLYNQETAELFRSIIQQSNFTGVTGQVYFVGADRISPIQVFQHTPTNNHQIVGVYTPSPDNTTAGQLTINSSLLVWPTGILPGDGRPSDEKCNYGSLIVDLFNVNCNSGIAIANLIILLSLFLVLSALVFWFKRRYDKKVKATEDRMKELGLMGLHENGVLALDDWEIPRDKVVLNRKLGEGAFGTVYGGEANFDQEWIAIAVKTLKAGSSAEDKMDFLSEAEIMKRFEHENIVQLYGVCTRMEPAYTVMEFMLYGDLKTFLLSRRQLVNCSDKDAEMVSSPQLTNFAFHITSGLHYLSGLNYIHRDIALRNCLVNNHLVVKLSDFGMTRSLYDSDYYRFGRKGMLPVRWMAPESLGDGIFTLKSDIWGLGVVFYEIVTFGSLPYQGMANREVLEYVKMGQSLIPPQECNPKLSELMISCWSIEHSSRPSTSDVLALFESGESGDSCLLSPCLDIPKYNVLAGDDQNSKVPASNQNLDDHHIILRQNSSGRKKQASIKIALPPLPPKTVDSVKSYTSILSMCGEENPSPVNARVPVIWEKGHTCPPNPSQNRVCSEHSSSDIASLEGGVSRDTSQSLIDSDHDDTGPSQPPSGPDGESTSVSPDLGEKSPLDQRTRQIVGHENRTASDISCHSSDRLIASTPPPQPNNNKVTMAVGAVSSDNEKRLSSSVA